MKFTRKHLCHSLFFNKITWNRYPRLGDPRPGTLIIHETRDPRLRTLKDEHETLMIGETGDPKQTSLVEPGAQEL